MITTIVGFFLGFGFIGLLMFLGLVAIVAIVAKLVLEMVRLIFPEKRNNKKGGDR